MEKENESEFPTVSELIRSFMVMPNWPELLSEGKRPSTFITLPVTVQVTSREGSKRLEQSDGSVMPRESGTVIST